MGTPEKPTTRGTTRRLKATQDLQASDSKATGLQATDLEDSAKNKKASAKTNPNRIIQACKQMENVPLQRLQPEIQQGYSSQILPSEEHLQNVSNIYAQRVSDMEGQMNSVLHSRDQLEAINAQLQQQNKLLQEQVALLRKQVNQAQAPGTPSPSPRVEQGTRGVVPEGYLGCTYGPHYLPGEHTTPRASTIHGHHSQQEEVGLNHSSHQGLWYPHNHPL